MGWKAKSRILTSTLCSACSDASAVETDVDVEVVEGDDEDPPEEMVLIEVAAISLMAGVEAEIPMSKCALLGEARGEEEKVRLPAETR